MTEIVVLDAGPLIHLDEIIEVLRSIPARSTLHVRNQFLNKIIDEVVQSP